MSSGRARRGDSSSGGGGGGSGRSGRKTKAKGNAKSSRSGGSNSDGWLNGNGSASTTSIDRRSYHYQQQKRIRKKRGRCDLRETLADDLESRALAKVNYFNAKKVTKQQENEASSQMQRVVEHSFPPETTALNTVKKIGEKTLVRTVQVGATCRDHCLVHRRLFCGRANP